MCLLAYVVFATMEIKRGCVCKWGSFCELPLGFDICMGVNELVFMCTMCTLNVSVRRDDLVYCSLLLIYNEHYVLKYDYKYNSYIKWILNKKKC